MSTLDLVGQGRFAVLTGIGGEAWADAAHAASERFGIPVETHVIGPGRELEDLFGNWAEAREVGEAGCVLVRPDQHVAWRVHGAAVSGAEAGERLADALGRILGRRGREMERAAE